VQADRVGGVCVFTKRRYRFHQSHSSKVTKLEKEHATELILLSEQLAYFSDQFCSSARTIAHTAYAVPYDDLPPSGREAIKNLANLLPEVKQSIREINEAKNRPIIAQIYTKLSDGYPNSSDNTLPLRSECLHRILAHFCKIAKAADKIVRAVEASTLSANAGQDSEDLPENLDNHDDECQSHLTMLEQYELAITAPTSETDTYDLWSLSAMFIEGTAPTERFPSLFEEFGRYEEAAQLLRLMGNYSDLTMPVSSVLNSDDEIAKSLTGRSRALYKALNVRRGIGMFYSRLREVVWDQHDESEENIKDDSIRKDLDRLNHELVKFRLIVSTEKIDNDKKAFLRDLGSGK